jgi:hypothetical protein
MWLSGTKINKPGAGMLSIFGELDEPASVLIVRHHWDKPEVTISKPVKWDRIMLDGTEYARMCERKLFVFGTSEGESGRNQAAWKKEGGWCGASGSFSTHGSEGGDALRP